MGKLAYSKHNDKINACVRAVSFSLKRIRIWGNQIKESSRNYLTIEVLDFAN